MGKRHAVLIGMDTFQDGRLSKLLAPKEDVLALRNVLLDPAIGKFDTAEPFFGCDLESAQKLVHDLFDNRKSDDLLFFYYSGHGLVDQTGTLYLSLKGSNPGTPSIGSLESEFIRKRMKESAAKSQIIVLDCCHSGAFMEGAKGTTQQQAVSQKTFDVRGKGHYVLSACSATEFAYEDGKLRDGDPDSRPRSIFTKCLVNGLINGDAAPQENQITIDALYQYTHDRVVESDHSMEPFRWIAGGSGDLIIANNPNVRIPVADELRKELLEGNKFARLGAIANLKSILETGSNAFKVEQARQLLEKGLDSPEWVEVERAIKKALDRQQNEETPAQKKNPQDHQTKENHTKRASLDSVMPSEPARVEVEQDAVDLFREEQQEFGDAREAGEGEDFALAVRSSALNSTLSQRKGEAVEELFSTGFSSVSDEFLRSLGSVVREAARRSRRILVVCEYDNRRRALVKNEREFLAAVLADHILVHSGEGLLAWFISKTSEIGRPKENLDSRVALSVWGEITRTYMRKESDLYNLKLEEEIYSCIRKTLSNNANRIFVFFQNILDVTKEEPSVVEGTLQFIRSIRSELGESAKPSLLEKLIYLEGQAARLIRPKTDNGLRFETVRVPSSDEFDYEFEVMKNPLTNLEYATLCGEELSGISRPQDPYLLGPWRYRTKAGDRYPQVAAELRAILDSCEASDNKDGYIWCIPTIHEWLRFSGCNHSDYPWGSEAPKPKRANLNFGKAERIRPVGLYPSGNSGFGVNDCCGNVHELVWMGESQRLPTDARLMGGCFLTKHEREHSSCRKIRKLSVREPDERQNIGIRFIRVAIEHEEARWRPSSIDLNGLNIIGETPE